MIKAMFFDLDGTLVDTLPLYIRSYDRALRELGVVLSDKEIVATCFGQTEADICRSLGLPNKVEQFTATYFSGVKQHFKEAKIFPGVMDCIDWARKQGIKLGIISFAYNWYVDGMVEALELRPYFEIILGHNDVSKPKPDPESIMLACNKLSMSPEETVMIGDSSSDIKMGKAAGSQTVLYHPTEYSLFYNLETLMESKPGKCIKDYSELVDSLNSFSI